MKANKNLPETAPQASQETETVRMINGFTAVLRGADMYFLEIEAMVDRALAKQNGAR